MHAHSRQVDTHSQGACLIAAGQVVAAVRVVSRSGNGSRVATSDTVCGTFAACACWMHSVQATRCSGDTVDMFICAGCQVI